MRFETGLAIVAMLLGSAEVRAGEVICPDRPGKGGSPCILEPGRYQAELGLFDQSIMRRDGVTTNYQIVGDGLLKYGVSDTLDIEAGLALYQARRVHDSSGTDWAGDIGDLTLHAKWNPQVAGFALALDPYIKLPTASAALGNGHVEGGIAAPTAFDLGGHWSLAVTPKADALLDGKGGGYHANLSGTAALSKSIDELSLGAEVWREENFDPAGSTGFASLDLTAAYRTNADTRLDAGINLGLNRATPDVEFYFGVSRRF